MDAGVGQPEERISTEQRPFDPQSAFRCTPNDAAHIVDQSAVDSDQPREHVIVAGLLWGTQSKAIFQLAHVFNGRRRAAPII